MSQLVWFLSCWTWSLHRLSVPDGLHPPSCGLSLWQHQDGEVPAAAPGAGQQQDEGELHLSRLMMPNPVLASAVSTVVDLMFASVLASRWATPPCTRRLSRATRTSSPCCWNTVLSPTRPHRWDPQASLIHLAASTHEASSAWGNIWQHKCQYSPLLTCNFVFLGSSNDTILIYQFHSYVTVFQRSCDTVGMEQYIQHTRCVSGIMMLFICL